MSYRTQAVMATDDKLMQRLIACAAREGVDNPFQWAHSRNWIFSAEPGWDDAYAYAIATGVQDPGNNEGVITDGMICSALQAILTAEAAE